MSIEDLTKAFWILNGDPLAWVMTVQIIKEGKIFFDNGQVMELSDLVQAYNEEYGE